MARFKTFFEKIYKQAADQTVFINPNHKEMVQAYKRSSRGTMLWDSEDTGDWFLSSDDVVHQTLANEINIRHDVVNFYMYPTDKIMSLGYNYVDYREQGALGSYIPYAKMSQNPYWKTLSDHGWVFKDISGTFDAKGLQERIDEHPMETKMKKQKEYERSRFLDTLKKDKELLAKLELD